MADYGEDWLQRIVGVHWREQGPAGSIFVYGMTLGNEVGYVNFKNSTDTDPKIRTVVLPEPSVDDLPAFSVKGSSFAVIRNVEVEAGKDKPVFLLAGDRKVPSEAGEADSSLIYMSNDGLTWDLAFEQTLTSAFKYNGSLKMSAVVWEPTARTFYFSQAYNLLDTTSGSAKLTRQEQIFSSIDGISWSSAAEIDIPPDEGYISSFPSSYCSHNSCIDDSGQHVPDGVIWQNITSTSVARPAAPPIVNYAGGSIGFSELGNNNAEIINTEIDVTFTVSIPGITTLTCIAGAGGVLLAGGWTDDTGDAPGAIVCSRDGGQTWEFLTSTPVVVTTMVGATL